MCMCVCVYVCVRMCACVPVKCVNGNYFPSRVYRYVGSCLHFGFSEGGWGGGGGSKSHFVCLFFFFSFADESMCRPTQLGMY